MQPAVSHFETISRAQQEYARCIDDGDLADWPDFFAEKCLYRVTTAENHDLGLPAGLIYASSRGMLVDRVESLRTANIFERQKYRHIIGLPYLSSNDDGTIRSECSFIVIRIMRNGETSLFVSGRYLDLYDVSGATPLLNRREVICDSSRIDTLLAIPL